MVVAKGKTKSSGTFVRVCLSSGKRVIDIGHAIAIHTGLRALMMDTSHYGCVYMYHICNVYTGAYMYICKTTERVAEIEGFPVNRLAVLRHFSYKI